MAPLLYNDSSISSPTPTREIKAESLENSGYNKVYTRMKVSKIKELVASNARYAASSSSHSYGDYGGNSNSSSNNDLADAEHDKILRDNDIAPRSSSLHTRGKR